MAQQYPSGTRLYRAESVNGRWLLNEGVAAVAPDHKTQLVIFKAAFQSDWRVELLTCDWCDDEDAASNRPLVAMIAEQNEKRAQFSAMLPLPLLHCSTH